MSIDSFIKINSATHFIDLLTQVNFDDKDLTRTLQLTGASNFWMRRVIPLSVLKSAVVNSDTPFSAFPLPSSDSKSAIVACSSSGIYVTISIYRFIFPRFIRYWICNFSSAVSLPYGQLCAIIEGTDPMLITALFKS